MDNIIEALTPPKPNPLINALLMAVLFAVLAIIFKPSAASSRLLIFIEEGTVALLMDFTENIAAVAPAAPSK